MSQVTSNTIVKDLEALQEEYERKKMEALQPARNRLEEVRRQKAELESEEEELLEILGEGKQDRRRRKGKRVTAVHKKAIMGDFIKEGHIRNGSELTKNLRTALSDAGLGVNDFRKLDDYLPPGWRAESNGLRGSAARTVFYSSVS